MYHNSYPVSNPQDRCQRWAQVQEVKTLTPSLFHDILVSNWVALFWKGPGAMTLDEIIQDIHALEKDLLVFERKYGIL